MSDEKCNLPEVIKKITFHFIKKHYDDYLKTNNLLKIPDDKLEPIINGFYDDKEKELKRYIRGTMRKNFPNYDKNFTLKTTTEEILLEMFDDADYCKNRVLLEIQNYQDLEN